MMEMHFQDEVKEIPILNDVEINAELQIATSPMSVPNPGSNILQQLRASDKTALTTGMKITFTLPFKDLLKKYGVSEVLH